MRLNGVDIDGNFMPFDMQPSQLTMNFNGQSSTLSGSVLTQQGQINLSGDADWSQLDNWRARIAAKGSRVRITVPPMVRLDVSPDVVFEATPSLFTTGRPCRRTVGAHRGSRGAGKRGWRLQ